MSILITTGKVVLFILNPPPELLINFISRVTTELKLYFEKIRKFNTCFQTTSFGVTHIVQNTDNFEITFKIQNKIYHH